MDALAPELLLMIAQECDFATVCALSKSNRRFDALISSNFKPSERHHAQMAHFKCISVNGVVDDGSLAGMDNHLSVGFMARTRDGQEKMVEVNVFQTGVDSATVDLLKTKWKSTTYHPGGVVREVKDVTLPAPDQLLVELFAPLFGRSTIHQLSLKFLKVSTLQTVAAVLLDLPRWRRPPIYELEMELGVGKKKGDLQELHTAVTIIALAKPHHVKLTVGGAFTNAEISEHLLQKIAGEKMMKLTFGSGVWSGHMSGTDGNESNASRVVALLPKSCVLVQWYPHLMLFESGIDQIVQINLSDIVNLIEEWWRNERDIVHYKFNFCTVSKAIVDNLYAALRARNLPILVSHDEDEEVAAMYRLEKPEKRGDDQDELLIGFNRMDHPRLPEEQWTMDICSRRAHTDFDSDYVEHFELCRYC